MPSPLREKMNYARDRCVNAFWMIRNGKFKLIVKSIFIELDHRVMKVKTLLLHGRNPDYSKLPGSAYVNGRKIAPPSYTPTHPKCSPPPELQIDKALIAGELQAIRSMIIVQDDSQP